MEKNYFKKTEVDGLLREAILPSRILKSREYNPETPGLGRGGED